MASTFMPALFALASTVGLSPAVALPAIGESPWLGQESAELSVDSGLWRSQFLPKIDQPLTPEPNDHSPRPAAHHPPDASISPGDSIPEPSINRPFPFDETLMDLSQKDASDIVLQSAAADSADTGAYPSRAGKEVTLSDWERAATKSSGTGSRFLQNTGPSVISIIVAVVGLIVMSGAYFTSPTGRL